VNSWTFPVVDAMKKRNGQWFVYVCVNGNPRIAYPLEQARDLFPILVALYVMMQQIPTKDEPDLLWIWPYHHQCFPAIYGYRLILLRYYRR
jgi:hypothetical protein